MDLGGSGKLAKEKEFDTSFTIPKKTTTTGEGEPKVDGQQQPENMGHASIMANAYANFMPATHQYQTGTQFAGWTAQQQDSNQWENYCQNVYKYLMNTNTSQKGSHEQPKVTRSDVTYSESFSEVNDPSLPRELTAMFQPLYCKLCSAQLSSNVMAKTHYKSKNHEKKVRRFLIEYSERTGEPLHKRAKVVKTQAEPEEYNPRYFHCDVCDLPLTGKIHAESHYMGRNHQKVVMGKKPPAGKGTYNEEGKWVRAIQTKTSTAVGPNNDGFGLDFLATKPTFGTNADNAMHCDLCNVSVTSVPQMEMHLQGQKHRKKLKQQQTVGLAPVAFYGEISAPEQSAEALFVKGNPTDILSSYRTPSGQYYCKICNLSLNSETQFMQHLNSKKHLKKSN